MKLSTHGIKLSMNSPEYCLDTHPLIWYFTQATTLSQSAKSILEEIFRGASRGILSPIVLLEIFHISRKNKKVVFSKFLKKLQKSNISLISTDAAILGYCYQLPKSLEIHDRIIAATALATQSVLITKDPELRALQTIKTIW